MLIHAMLAFKDEQTFKDDAFHCSKSVTHAWFDLQITVIVTQLVMGAQRMMTFRVSSGDRRTGWWASSVCIINFIKSIYRQQHRTFIIGITNKWNFLKKCNIIKCWECSSFFFFFFMNYHGWRDKLL
jgi:hypothetical protein